MACHAFFATSLTSLYLFSLQLHRCLIDPFPSPLSHLTIKDELLRVAMEEAEKVDVKDEEETLDIRVKDQSGEELFFKVKPHTQMGKSLIHLEKS